MAKEPILETERLILRPHNAGDAGACFAWQSDPEVMRFLSRSTSTDISDTKEWLRKIENADSFMWAIVLKKSGTMIGTCAIGESTYMPNYWNFAYYIRRDEWNKGYATEAAKAMIRFAKEEQNIKKFCAVHAVDNPASGRVIEKCGLKFHHHGEYSKLDGSATFKAKYYILELE